MSSTDSSNSGGGGFDNLNQNVFGLTALIVSLVALVTTVLQVLQQYFSSAEGYRRCAPSVMGEWSQGTHRRLVAREFRVEVVFETPVIFVADPKNVKGPVPNRAIHYVDGTPSSYKDTKILQPQEQDIADRQAVARVHTADDERASWVTLLSALQLLERKSREWDRENRPRGTQFKAPTHQIAVGLQGKKRSWDFIPSSITKPYATSAICHLVEMMAILGLYWKVFDDNRWNLRAEGNGYILTSTTVHGLGVMVVFAVTGRSSFEKNRVIPCNEVKDLAFGTVPNIFENKDYLDKRKNAQSIVLMFGENEVSDTLESLGCNNETIKQFGKDHKHIFSVYFEIIGMLGKVFRIRGSNFRMLPNPTHDFWLKQVGHKASWSIVRLMEVFQDKLAEVVTAEGFSEQHRCSKIAKAWAKIKSQPEGCEDEADLNIDTREAIHDALDDITDFLLSFEQIKVLSVLVSHLTHVLKILEDPDSGLNSIILANKEEMLINFYFDNIRHGAIGHQDSNRKPLTNAQKDERGTIWISLIFRMLCWLLLHDFDKADRKTVPSDLKGSRMPVYIG